MHYTTSTVLRLRSVYSSWTVCHRPDGGMRNSFSLLAAPHIPLPHAITIA